MKNRLALSFALVSIFTVSASAPAQAVDLKKMMKQYVDKNVLNKSNPAQAATQNNINLRQTQLEQQINSGSQSGKLTLAEATELRGMLNNIATQESTALADGKLHDPEVIQMVQDMDKLQAKITEYLGNSNTTTAKPATPPPAAKPAPTSTPPAAPSHAVSTSGASLHQKISNSLAAGKINRAEANDLFKIEMRMHDLETKLRKNVIGSFDQNRAMFKELEQLNDAITRKLAN